MHERAHEKTNDVTEVCDTYNTCVVRVGCTHTNSQRLVNLLTLALKVGSQQTILNYSIKF